MTVGLNRREFLSNLSLGAAAFAIHPVEMMASPMPTETKWITGSWFEIQHHETVEGVDWNPELVRFTAMQWEAKVKEIADIGLEYLVLMATALDYRSFYKSKIYPQWKLACDDPLEAALSAADKYKVKFFIGAGFFGDFDSDAIITDPIAEKNRLRSIEEVARIYGHHPSFYGWYWPAEAFINPRYAPEFIRYVNTNSRLARQMKPEAKIMIAPYGTRVAIPDDEYVRQLDAMDVDIVAYQDEVGVRKSKVTETSAFFEGLRKAHDRSQKAKIWADVEIFEFENEVYKSALMPAPFDRVVKQLEAVSPWVDQILVYQYQGMMNKPDSSAFAGCQASTRLYSDYVNWLANRRAGRVG